MWVLVIPIVVSVFRTVPKGIEQFEIGGRIATIQITTY